MFTKGHQVDPWQFQIYESILTMQSQLRKYTRLQERVWACLQRRDSPDCPFVWAGPVGQFRSSMQKIGWQIHAGFRITTQG